MTTAMSLAKQPSILPLYMACLLKSAQGKTQSEVIEDLTLKFNGCDIDQKKLKKFNRFFGFSHDAQVVPTTFIHLLVFRPQLKFLLNKALPFPVMGLVHLFNDIISHESVSIDDKLDITISVKEFSEKKKGKELTIHTQVHSKGRLVWESFSGFLYPNKQKRKTSIKSPTNLPNKTHSSSWELASNLGRQFALLSGDANPIHTYKLAAKIFGFKQAIAHGMCMALKCGSEISHIRADNAPIKRLYVEFKKPVFLPNTVSFNYETEDQDAVDFDVISQDGKQTCLLKGYVCY